MRGLLNQLTCKSRKVIHLYPKRVLSIVGHHHPFGRCCKRVRQRFPSLLRGGYRLDTTTEGFWLAGLYASPSIISYGVVTDVEKRQPVNHNVHRVGMIGQSQRRCAPASLELEMNRSSWEDTVKIALVTFGTAIHAAVWRPSLPSSIHIAWAVEQAPPCLARPRVTYASDKTIP